MSVFLSRRMGRLAAILLAIGFSALVAATGLRVAAAGSSTLNNLPTTYSHPTTPEGSRSTSSCDPSDHYCYNGKGAPLPGRIDCSISNYRCTDIDAYGSYKAYGHYVGHDEPAVEYYSNTAGSGAQDRWQFQLPADPPTQPTRSNGVTWNFMLHPAIWFGMALCNDGSYPEVHTNIGDCKPGSDSNIADCGDSSGATCQSTADGCPPNATGSACYIGNHVGGAYMEFQFYPPGWAPLAGNAPIGGESCDPVKWCAAMVIWSLGADGDFKTNNADCLNNSNGGEEFGNAAFITFTGHSPIPATPYKNPNAFAPTPSADMYYNSGDALTISMNDIPDSSPGPNGSGLQIVVNDQTTGQTGSMVASAVNGFATEKWAPSATSCTMIPYNFHPMYSTSGLHTRIPWAAHSYNVAFTDEIGHFDYCTNVTKNNNGDGGCGGNEGTTSDSEPAEQAFGGSFGDDSVCYDGASPATTTLVPIGGCMGSNWGFDNATYKSASWPNGDFAHRPTPVRFTSPTTGSNFSQQYSDYALETDLPALEFTSGIIPAFGTGMTASPCDILNGGIGCTYQPPTDDTVKPDPVTGNAVPNGSTDAGFYPFFSIDTHQAGQCWWLLGNDVTGQTSNDFNNGVADSQYGAPYNIYYEQQASAPSYALPLAENFHTVGTTQMGQANPNTCTAALPAVNTPEIPSVPLFALGGTAVVAGAALAVRRRRSSTAA
ncbi:MAG: hypothetical protein ABR498_09360 [Candidatus Dormibacteria bacterium]